MKIYNVEIFDNNINFLQNTKTEDLKIKEDYLDPEKYNVDLFNISGLKINSFIHFQSEDSDHIAVINSFENKEESITRVSVTEIPAMFDVDILENINNIGSGTFEDYIKTKITDLFVTGDQQAKLPLNITTSSNTPNWMIDYKWVNEPRNDEPVPEFKAAEMNLFDDIILQAFLKYQIIITYHIDLKNKNISLDIGKNTEQEIAIEADLPAIISKKIIINKATKNINKIHVYNKDNYASSLTFYLHPDGTFDRSDSNRVTPVFYQIKSAKQKVTSGTVTETFEQAATKLAQGIFEKNKYTNLIELEILNNDPLSLLNIGQKVKVLSEGTEYNSILTGKEIGDTTKLIFGTVRTELTKILKGRA